MPLAAGAQTTVTQSYSVGAAGTGRLTLTATGTNASNPGYYNVPILAPLAERFPSTVTGGYFTKDSRYLNRPGFAGGSNS